MKLKGKVAIVTGAGRGIGRAISLEYAREGADVVVSDIDLQAATDAAKEVRSLGREELAVKVDVSDSTEVREMAENVLNRFGKIDILVNNAGFFKRTSPIVDLSEEEWDKAMDVNLKGTFLCTKYVGKQMTKQREGLIINIASISGLMPFVHWGPYSPSKAGVISLTQLAALELAEYNIRVNAICPGPIRTPLTDIVYADKKLREARIKSIPLNRFGEAEEVAKVAVFLACEDSSYMTGHAIVVDGGSSKSTFHLIDMITKGLFR